MKGFKQRANTLHEKMIMNTYMLVMIFILLLPYGFAHSEDDMKYKGDNMLGYEEEGLDTQRKSGYKRNDMQYQGGNVQGYEEQGVNTKREYLLKRNNMQYEDGDMLGFEEQGVDTKREYLHKRYNMQYEDGNNMLDFEEQGVDTEKADQFIRKSVRPAENSQYNFRGSPKKSKTDNYKIDDD